MGVLTVFNLTVYPTGNITLGAPGAGFFNGVARLQAWAEAAFRRVTAARVPAPVDEIAQLRAMADDLLKTDPSFAQDLYAAADRCERETLAQL
jgi:hypothetical protein